jgi:hypothetical protein
LSEDAGKDDGIIDISAEDLDEEPAAAAPVAPAEPAGLPAPPLPGELPAVPGGASAGTVDIDLDLSDLDVEPVAPTAPLPGLQPGMALSGPVTELPGDMGKMKGKQTFTEAVVSATLNVLPLAVAGGLGGLLAWGITEPFTRDEGTRKTLVETMRDMALYGGIVGACVAMAIGSIDGITAADGRRALRGAGLGLLIGLLGGGLGGVMAQIVYGSLQGGQGLALPLQIVVRSVGWALVGLFVGLAPGIIARARGKLVNGVVGGLIGGAIGGFLFDPIGFVVGGGLVSRMIALGALGVASGAAIAVVEQVRKEAWLLITAGPLSGKQFILYNPVTTIGRAYEADISLVKETAAAPMHCRITRGPGDFTLEDLSGGATVVNGRVARSQRLGSGDVIQIGKTGLTFYERAAGKG